MARVKIVKIPKAQNGIDLGAGASGTNGSRQFALNNLAMSGRMSQEPIEARQTLQAVPRDQANLEAEKGETAVVNMGGMPAHFKIGGKRHSQGGTPLDLPDNSFIFSDTSKMKIKDPIIQAQFGMAFKKGGYTPADIAKKYDINKYRKTLADPDSEDIDRNTAEMMISNYNLKLAKLGLVQESIKGFPQGIPVIAMPYIMTGQIDPSEFLPDQAQEQQEGAAQPDANMGTARYGGIPKAQNGYATNWQELTGDAFKSKKSDTPSYEKLINTEESAPSDFLGIRKGFSGDQALEEKWAADTDVGPYYRLYKDALRSNNPKIMREAAAKIKAVDIPGFEWWLGSGQNKLTDFAQILNEEAYKINKKSSPKVTSKESLDINTRKIVSEAFTKAANLKRKAKDAGNVESELHYDEVLTKLHELHPEYKAAHFWRKEDKGIINKIHNTQISAVQALMDPAGLNIGSTSTADNQGPVRSLNQYRKETEPIFYSTKDVDAIEDIKIKYPELFEEVKKEEKKPKADVVNLEEVATDVQKASGKSADKKTSTEPVKTTTRKPLRNWG